jgi:hypothetical protein
VAPFLIIRSEVTMFCPMWDSDFPATKIMGNRKLDTDLIDIYWNKRIMGSWKKEPLKRKWSWMIGIYHEQVEAYPPTCSST